MYVYSGVGGVGDVTWQNELRLCAKTDKIMLKNNIHAGAFTPKIWKGIMIPQKLK